MESAKRIFLFCCILELAIILCISIANLFNSFSYAFFYNLLYGIGISVLLPLLILQKERSDLSSVGIKNPSIHQILVLISFIALSVGGQIIPKLINGELLCWYVLPVALLPLIMTTFFEEFLFRGFLQTRLEKNCGSFISVLISGLLFSLYHLGYPGFRTLSDISLLFAVGIGFALAFKLSNNNLIVSYFVNLPNAFTTYVIKHEQFPVMTIESSIYAGGTIILIAILVFCVRYRKEQTDSAQRN